MRSDSPSQTAMAAAFLRALHTVADDPPRVFEDPLAAAFLPGYQQRFLARLQALPQGWTQAFRQRRSAIGRMRAQILVRSRYAEDALAGARGAGAVRYLILAAGLDTFAWRQDDPPIPVIELDHPATQRWKQDMLERTGRRQPASVTLQPIDFERQALSEVLTPAPGPQFISWLGTTYYLTHPILHATLSTLATLSPRRSRLALDYWEDGALGLDTPLLWGTRLATAMQLEPMRCFLTPARLHDLADASGWHVRETLDATAQNERYLSGRSDGLEVPAFAHLALLERP